MIVRTISSVLAQLTLFTTLLFAHPHPLSLTNTTALPSSPNAQCLQPDPTGLLLPPVNPASCSCAQERLFRLDRYHARYWFARDAEAGKYHYDCRTCVIAVNPPPGSAEEAKGLFSPDGVADAANRVLDECTDDNTGGFADIEMVSGEEGWYVTVASRGSIGSENGEPGYDRDGGGQSGNFDPTSFR